MRAISDPPRIVIVNLNAPFQCRIGPILISRFLINLREISDPDNETALQDLSRFSAPGFRVPTTTIDRVIGNMGESLVFGNYGDEDETIGQSDGDLSRKECQEWE